jgi:formylglycine-generating enzyme required for sulfatase activity
MFRYISFILLLLLTYNYDGSYSNFSSSRMEAKLMSISNAKRQALIIGNSDYQFIPSLSNSVNDAQDVAAALNNLNYEVIVLTNASYKAMFDTVQQFIARLAKLGSVGLFYFSGHGLQTDGRNYLIPVDAQIKTEADIKALSLDANYVLAKMNEAKNQVNIMILDACRNNPFKQSIINSKGLVQITPLSVGNFISFATLPMQTTSSAKKNERNSIYTKYLLAALKNQPNVPIHDVFIDIRNHVILETKNNKIQQVPWDSNSLRHKFCFGECLNVDDTEKLKLVHASLETQTQQCTQPLNTTEPVVNFSAIFNPPPLQEVKRDMFEKTEAFKKRLQKYHEHRMQLFDNSLAEFNQAVKDGNRRYQAGIVTLNNYDADKEKFYIKIKWQAGWVKKFFNELPSEKQKWIKISPSKAKEFWQSGKQKPFFITVKRSGDHSVISSAIIVNGKNIWNIFGFPKKDKIDNLKISKNLKNDREFTDRLKNGDFGPKMVWISAGSFKMGDIQTGGDSDENPLHQVSVKKFAIGKYEVSFAEYDKFAEATARNKPDDRGWGRGNRPVINVSWHDATAYANWLSQQTGQTYRLPTEAEWEYAARAGTNTKYWWGNTSSHKYANYNQAEDGWKYTAPVGSFAANPFGLHDTVGNVWEWTCSKYTYKYNGEEQRCIDRKNLTKVILRGGSWNSEQRYVRSSNRGKDTLNDSNDGYGFRLVRLVKTTRTP